MIVHLHRTEPPTVSAADDLTALSIRIAPTTAVDDVCGDALCTGHHDDGHVWLDIDELRTLAEPQATTPGWRDDFSQMIAYARGKGWLDDSGRAVRAHVVR